MVHPDNRGLWQEVKRGIYALQGNGRIVFVPDDSSELRTVAGNRGHDFRARIQLLVWIRNCIGNLCRRHALPVAGEITGNEATLAVEHVAIGTARFAEEQ